MAKLIVVDGLDGCGKTTQIKLLEKHLKTLGKEVVLIKNPNYESYSSSLVKMYLKGDIGVDANNINPYISSSFYSVDRFISNEKSWKDLLKKDDNTVILMDRYISANIIHQGGKIDNDNERKRFIEWLCDFEYDKAGLPEEDLTIILTVPPEVSSKSLDTRYNNDKNKRDIHENNDEYSKNCYKRLQSSIFDMISQGYHWCTINCVDNDNELLSIQDIHKIITSVVKQYI